MDVHELRGMVAYKIRVMLAHVRIKAKATGTGVPNDDDPPDGPGDGSQWNQLLALMQPQPRAQDIFF